MLPRCALFAAAVAACAPPARGFGDAATSDDAALDATASATPAGVACGLSANGEVRGGCSPASTRCLTDREGFPNGYCAPDCRRAPCVDGTACIALDAQRHVCFRRCTSSADCRAAEGYACQLLTPGGHAVCVPNVAPVGRRADGSACFAAGDADAGGTAPFLAPLPRVTFAAPSVSVSRMRLDALEEAQPSVAVLANGSAAVAFQAATPTGYWHGGVTGVGLDGVARAPTLELIDRDYTDLYGPALRGDSTGALHLVAIANTVNRPGNRVRALRSTDAGASFSRGADAIPGDLCNAGCSSPALAIGADDARYAGALSHSTDNNTRVLFARAMSPSGAFGAPVTLGAAEYDPALALRRVPSALAISAGNSTDVYLAWVATSDASGAARLGDRNNRVRLRASSDGGATFGDAVEIARAGDAPVEQPPAVGAGAGAVHVAYVHGGPTGAWDVVLATSMDHGRTFAHRVVNDDPDRCATHAFVGLAVGPSDGAAHVLFLDNRFGAGEVVYARCPADPRVRCSRNERVDDAPFVFDTSLDATRWHGTHTDVSLGADGALWAAWTDSRSGGPGVYLARGVPPR